MQMLVGHEWQREWLRSLASNGNLSHAYLFSGPEGVGKREIALEVAQTLYCENAQKPCKACVACKQVQSGVHPDLRLLKRSEPATMDDVRKVRDWLSGSSFGPKGKTLIIEEMGRLSTMAQNALLKSIEEPSGISYIFMTDSTENVIPTIRSRAQVVRFGLTQTGVDKLPKTLQRVGSGRPTVALGYINESEVQTEDVRLIELLDSLSDKSIAELSLMAEDLAGREDVERVINLWITYLETRLVDNPAVAGQLERLVQTRDQLRSNVNPKLAIWSVLLDLKLAVR